MLRGSGEESRYMLRGSGEETSFYRDRSRNPSLDTASLDATSLKCFGREAQGPPTVLL